MVHVPPFGGNTALAISMCIPHPLNYKQDHVSHNDLNLLSKLFPQT